jgi:hypothetical protein
MSDFKNEGGQISGKLVTDGKQEAFGQTREVNLFSRLKRSSLLVPGRESRRIADLR